MEVQKCLLFNQLKDECTIDSTIMQNVQNVGILGAMAAEPETTV